MAIRGKIRSKRASQHHNAVQKVLIKAILFDTGIIAQIAGVRSLFANPIYSINQAHWLMSFFSRHLTATIDLRTGIKNSSASDRN